MTSTASEKVRWTTADLELFPDDGKRYEIIDGELFVTRSPHWKHQEVCVNISTQLKIWSTQTGLGRVAYAPSIIFTDADNVIPDVVWASNESLASLLDEAGHLTGALLVGSRGAVSWGKAGKARQAVETQTLFNSRSAGILDF